MFFEVVLSYLSYFLTIIILNIIDFRRFKTIVNPFFLLSLPFTIVLVSCILFNSTLNFIPFYAPSLWVWTFGLILFWLSSLLVVKMNFIKNIGKQKDKVVAIEQNLYSSVNSSWIFSFAVILCIAICIVKFNHTHPGVEVGSKEMGEEMGSGGLVGRASNIILMAIPFYFGYRSPFIIKSVLIFLLMFFVVSLGTKTWLTYSIIACFMIYIQQHRLNFKLIAVVFLILTGSFMLYYKINTSIDDSNHFFTFIGRHLYFYITSGILPLGEYIKNSSFEFTNDISLPFIRLIYYWMGDNVSFHSNYWVTTDLILGTESNVYTLFGTIFRSGLDDYILYSLITGFLSYLSFFIFRKTKSIFAAISWGYTAAVLFFGWYNWGLSSLRIWEIYVYCIFFYFLCRIKTISIIVQNTNHPIR